jgi:hypothetical protein
MPGEEYDFVILDELKDLEEGDSTMNEAKEMFQQQTITALDRCADYLRDNAEDIAKRFSDESHGCKEWSIEFHAGEDGMFPWVEVRESVKTVGIIEAYGKVRGNIIRPIASDDETSL